MFKLLCVCIFVAKYANGFQTYYFKNKLRNNNPYDEEAKRRALSYFEHSAWSSSYSASNPSELDRKFGIKFQSPITIIKSPTIERTYRTEINVQQMSHPYLYQIMQMIPIKGQISFHYIYQKLFQFFLALQRFKPSYETLNSENIIQILQFVFPELGSKVNEIAKYPIGPPMLKALFEVVFAGLSRQDLDMIFRDAHTIRELIVNMVLYLCPSIRDNFQWKDDLPINEKLSTILNILFPGAASIQSLKETIQQGNFLNSMYTFLDLLFQGKLITGSGTTIQGASPEGPDWLNFQKVLSQNNIDYQTLPKEILLYLFSIFNTPLFEIYLTQFKNKLEETKTPNQMDTHTLIVWTQFMNDLQTHQKTLNDMPPEIKVFLQQHENPQELIKIISSSIGIPVDTSKLDIPLDPQILELWKKFIFDIMNHKGDTTHLPKQLLDYFNSLSQNPDYKSHLDVIFDGLSINPEIAVQWNTFFDQLRAGQTTMDQMPADLTTYLTNHQHPEEFLRIILKLKDSNINTNFLNIDTNPEMMQLWKKYIQDVAINKGNIRNIPQELLQYFYKLTANPANAEYIKLLFSPDQIDPMILNNWNQFVNDLKLHRVDLKDMPSEVIQLMLKYNSPDEFFKVFLPQTNVDVNMDVTPDETVKEQWKNWIFNLQNRNISVLDTPKELKDFFHKMSPSKDYQTILQEIDSINPDLLIKWKQFMSDLKHHMTSMSTMPEDLKKYILQMKSPKEFVNLIFKTLNPSLNNQIPTPSNNLASDWETFLKSIKEDLVSNGEVINGASFPHELTQYLQNASDDVNYKHALNNIYQMDTYVKRGFEDFKEKMLQDYNVTLAGLPQKLYSFLYKFELPTDMLWSVLAWYSEDVDVKRMSEVNMDPSLGMLWAQSLNNIFKLDKTEIHPLIKFIIKYLTKDTPLGSQIGEVIKLHESNALVTRVENLWRETKDEVRVHDGLEVFLQFLEKLGNYYGKSEELCDERFRIIKTLDRVRNGFAAKSECTTKFY